MTQGTFTTGPLSEETPLCVILEIADSCGVVYSPSDSSKGWFYSTMLSTVRRISGVQMPRTDQNVARLLNPKCMWSRTSMSEAMDFLNKFERMDYKTVLKGEKRICYGPQTPERPRSVNCRVMYKILSSEGVSMSRSWTFQDMVKMTEKIVSGNTTMDYGRLDLLMERFNDKNYLRRMVRPRDNEEAVALAAINYKFDLSSFSRPMSEYEKLSSDDYRITEEPMATWSKNCRDFFDLRKTFNPSFPESYYDPHDLFTMSLRSGNTGGGDTPYEYLQTAYLSDMFHDGRLPSLPSDGRTPIGMDDYDEVPVGLFLTYGPFQSPVGGISVEELADLLDANLNMTSPWDGASTFSPQAVGGLETFLCTSLDFPPEILEKRRRLVDSINRAQAATSNGDLTHLFQLHRSRKEEVERSLKLLLDVGYYMRGWDGTSPPPIVRAPVPPERELEVTMNVSRSISDFERDGLVEIADLPLLLYKEGEYQRSNVEGNGKTVRERMDIVKEGESTNNMASCIRLSSNWFCSTAHFYTTLLGLSPPFDIFHLRQIS